MDQLSDRGVNFFQSIDQFIEQSFKHLSLNYFLLKILINKMTKFINIIKIKQSSANLKMLKDIKGDQQLKFKIIFVGDTSVGKSNIRNVFCHGNFQYVSQPTIGVQYSRRKFWAPIQNKNNRLFTACFWDISGNLIQNELLPSYFKNVVGIIYVFDITNRQSLQSLKTWKSIINDQLNVNKVVQMLIGNKTDLVYLRQVTIHQAEKAKRQMKISFYYETSALQNINIKQAIFHFLSQVAKNGNQGVRKPLKLKRRQNQSKCYN